MDDEICATCEFWERRGGSWGRCWAPESDGDSLGIRLTMTDEGAALLETHEVFGCSAWVQGYGDEYSGDDE